MSSLLSATLATAPLHQNHGVPLRPDCEPGHLQKCQTYCEPSKWTGKQSCPTGRMAKGVRTSMCETCQKPVCLETTKMYLNVNSFCIFGYKNFWQICLLVNYYTKHWYFFLQSGTFVSVYNYYHFHNMWPTSNPGLMLQQFETLRCFCTYLQCKFCY